MTAGAAETATPRERRATPPATNAELDATFRELQTALETIDFFKAHNPPAIMRTIRAVFRRAGLDRREASLWKAIAYEIQKRR
jgi:tRNA C32,U32 (ribose-2'-O)-methylase TrmJ